MHGLIFDIGLVVIIATVVGVVMYRLKQPIILGYLLVGIIVGPEIGPQLISDPEHVETISEIGLILLLFIIGLELNLPSLIHSGKQLLVTGIGQFILCVGFGLLIFPLTEFNQPLEILYFSLLCALSSTAIVIKSLNDKFEMETLHGKVSVGVLIVQDLWAILILAFQPNFNSFQPSIVLIALLKGILLISAGFLLSRFVLKPVFEKIYRSPEMVVSTSIGWCAFMAFSAAWLGMSKEMGALIAGVSIASFPYSIHVTAKTLPLRDFFLTLFFVSLGMRIVFPEVDIILRSLGVAAFIGITRMLSIVPLILATGGGLRTGVISALNLSQLSEFSLVVAAIGVDLAHIHEDIFSILIYTMAITSIISSYFIQYNYQIFHQLERFLGRIGLKLQHIPPEKLISEQSYPVILLGCHRGAKSLLHSVQDKFPHLLNRILVIDFNLEALNELEKMGVAGLFGDISHLDTLQHARIEEAQIILSTIPDVLLKGTSNLELVELCRNLAPQAMVVATADFPAEAEELRKAGAHDVLLPYAMVGEFIANMLDKKLG